MEKMDDNKVLSDHEFDNKIHKYIEWFWREFWKEFDQRFHHTKINN